jgi:hypothetical protein
MTEQQDETPSLKHRKYHELPYYAKAKKVGPESSWNRYEVIVLDSNTDQQVGSYQRNYCLMDTFYPFLGKDEKWYALYSPHYTTTRIMSLPDCKDIGGEEIDGNGFCPMGFFVPQVHGHDFPEDDNYYKLKDSTMSQYDEWNKRYPFKGIFAPYGFVGGCVWGDDSSEKVQFLDLSRAHEGILVRDDRFGYHELPRGVSLAEGVEIQEPDWDSLSSPTYHDRTAIFIASPVR